jgi:pilus assembly protein Flp/PilA
VAFVALLSSAKGGKMPRRVTGMGFLHRGVTSKGTPPVGCSPANPFARTKERINNMSSRFLRPVLHFLKNEDGPTAVEYAVMLALIIVVCITAIQTLGSNANNTFSYVASQVGKTSGS